jgi:DNA modification methylase
MVAARAGVHRDTLLRWLREAVVAEPARDRRGWRVFTESEAARIESFAKATSNSRSPDPRSSIVRSESIERLYEIDWDFADAKTAYLTHGLHPYPAKYIPQIPNALIQELSSTGETVGDVFCGSGTTLVEALVLKRHAFGLDANPLACLITKTKTTPLSAAERSSLLDLSHRAEALGGELSSQTEGSLFGPALFQSRADRPRAEDLPFWFEPFVIEELAEARAWSQSLPTEATQRAALVCLSSIIVAVSKQDSDTRYVRRAKDVTPGETLRRFGRSLRLCSRMLAELADIVEPRFTSTVVNRNILEQPESPVLDLVVCSPPYPNAYSYHLYHRTRMLWLEMDQPTFKRVEIGSHRKYSSKSKSAATIETFRSELHTLFAWMRKALRPTRHACFVVGNSTIGGRVFDNGDLLSEVARAEGFVEEARLKRHMLDSRKAFNPAHGKIKSEDIVILRNARGGAL